MGVKDDFRSLLCNVLNFFFYLVDLVCKIELEMKFRNLIEMDGCGEFFVRLIDDKE